MGRMPPRWDGYPTGAAVVTGPRLRARHGLCQRIAGTGDSPADPRVRDELRVRKPFLTRLPPTRRVTVPVIPSWTSRRGVTSSDRDATGIIWKQPDPRANADATHFEVASVGIFLRPDRVVIVVADERPPISTEQPELDSLVEFVLRIMFATVQEFVARLRAIKRTAGEIQGPQPHDRQPRTGPHVQRQRGPRPAAWS